MAPVLGYWNIRSLGQPTRNLLVYKGVEFEDKRYEYDPPPDYGVSAWLKDKFTLGLTFPNLPYYIDEDVRLTQSLAILRYLGRKHDLAARNNREMAELDVIEQQARDLCLALIKASTPDPKAEGGIESYAKTMGETLGGLPSFQEVGDGGEAHEYFTSDRYAKWPILGYPRTWGFKKSSGWQTSGAGAVRLSK
ncbi:hypothetical protein HPB51_014409 [Rhipicephalus microplus]|uniref:glutathione transferase n=1 Tax=Rhipicephalus microplus TaxID=6941 RepID=A0A9J6F4U2_RHIMP|nr:hypothetical protein HPB51_014409 [Rhipicephalus microplus]